MISTNFGESHITHVQCSRKKRATSRACVRPIEILAMKAWCNVNARRSLFLAIVTFALNDSCTKRFLARSTQGVGFARVLQHPWRLRKNLEKRKGIATKSAASPMNGQQTVHPLDVSLLLFCLPCRSFFLYRPFVLISFFGKQATLTQVYTIITFAEEIRSETVTQSTVLIHRDSGGTRSTGWRDIIARC